MVKVPARPIELGLAVTDQDAVLPEIETEAQPTPELAPAPEQSRGVGVTMIFPAPPAEPALTLVGFKA